MTVLYLIAFSFCLAAVCNLLLISLGLALARGQNAASAVSYGAAMAVIAGGAVFIVAADNFGVVASGVGMDAVETAITLAAGPVFFLLIASLSEYSISIRAVLAPVVLVAAVLIVRTIMTGADADIRSVVIVQIGYSVAAGVLLLKATSLHKRNISIRIARLLILMMFSVHAAQLARMMLPHAAALKPAVPIVISAFAFAIVFAAALRAGARFARSRSVGEIELDEARLRNLIRADHAFLSPDFRLADLAASAKASAPELSRAINEQTGGGFVELVNSERLRHACELLRDPREARSSIEAIALLSGFRSRSAFYRAFTKSLRVTPAAYRSEFSDVHVS